MTGLGVVAVLAALAGVSLPLAVFGTAGVVLGGLVRPAVRRRRWHVRRTGRVAAAGLVVASVAAALLALLRTDAEYDSAPPAREVVTARYVGEARYRDDALMLEERLALPPRQLALLADRLAAGEPNEDPAQVVASRLEARGLEIVEVVDGALVARFAQRSLPVEASRWSLRTTLDFDLPAVDLGPVILEPDRDSFVTITAPRRLVTETSPPAVSVDSLPAGQERRRIELGSEFATAGSVTLELRGPLARTPVVGELLETSPWDAVYWLVGVAIGFFRKKLTAFMHAAFDGLLGRARRVRSAASSA